MNDAKDIVRRCNGCQRFADKPHAPGSELRPIPMAWPFAQWGLDMIGKLPKSSKGGHVYLLVAVDKFTKWIEAMPVTNQKGKTSIKFFESIVYRFGVPHSTASSPTMGRTSSPRNSRTSAKTSESTSHTPPWRTLKQMGRSKRPASSSVAASRNV